LTVEIQVIKAPVVSLSKKFHPHFSVLVGASKVFENDLRK